MTQEEFMALIDKANARYDAMSREEQDAMWRAQKQSWVIGELMLEHPELTREEAEERVQDCWPEYMRRRIREIQRLT